MTQAQTAHTGGSVTTVASSLGETSGVALDMKGDVFISSDNEPSIYRSTYSNGTYSAPAAVVALPSGTSAFGITSDAAGDLFAALSDGAVIKWSYSNGVYGAATTVATGLGTLYQVAVDPVTGNLFIDSYSGGVVYKATPNGSGGYSAATSFVSGLTTPEGVTVDQSGNVYITNSGKSQVLKVPYANGAYGAQVVLPITFTGPVAVQVDGHGNIYLTNSGTWEEVLSGGTYTQEKLSSAGGYSVVVDLSGSVYYPDYAGNVFKFQTAAATNFGPIGVGVAATPLSITFSVDTAGTFGTPLVLTKGTSNLDYTLGSGSTCTGALSAGATCIVNVAFKPQVPGPRYGAVQLTNSNGAVVASAFVEGVGSGPAVTFTPGTLSTIAGNGTAGNTGNGAAATSAELNSTAGVAVDSAGNLYIADANAEVIRKITASTGAISKVAGNGTSGYSGDNGAATSAELSNPSRVAVDGAGNLYIADEGNQRIREVNVASGIITTVAGNGTNGYSGDTAGATSAELSYPYAVAVDGTGNIYIADTGNARIRKVNVSTGIITTVVGNGTAGYSGDGTAATSAEISSPRSIAIDALGDLYIADFGNNRIREVNPTTGVISTVAGDGSSGYYGDGGAATSAELNAVLDVALDGAGDLYVADSSNNRIRKVTASTGMITTVAGNGTLCTTSATTGCLDGGAATSGELNGPQAVAMDGIGNLYIGDTGDGRVREVTAKGAALSFATTAFYSTSSDSPKAEILSNTGTTALTLPAPTTGGNPSIATGFTISNSSTCPQLSTNSSAGTLASGASCTYLLGFTPQAVGSISGSLVTTVENASGSAVTQSVSLSGTGTIDPQTINFTAPPSPVGYVAGETVTLSATASSSLPVTFSVVSGPATISGSTVTYTGAGTVVLAANQAGNTDYLPALQVEQTVVVESIASAYTASNTNVASTSTTKTATILFTSSVTLNSTLSTAIQVLTQGAPNQDFNYVSGGTCAAGASYTVGQICTVAFSFTPKSAGSRFGGIVLETSANTVAATAYVSGIGVGPLGLFTSSTQTSSITTFTDGQAVNTPRGLSTDGFGNIYFYDTGSGRVGKIVPGGTQATYLGTITGGDSGGTVVDGAGNLYVGSTSKKAIYEYVGAAGTAQSVVTGTCGSDDNLVVDGAGNLYYSCYSTGSGAIEKVAAITRSTTQLFAGNLGHRFIGMAVDAAGDVFAPDFNSNTLFELAAGASSLATIVAPDNHMSNPHGIAVDPAGNIYITNYNTSYNVLRYSPNGYGYSFTSLPAIGSRGVVLDGSGDLFTIPNDSSIVTYSRSTPSGGLTFPATSVGTFSNSTQSVEYENDGNAALVISAYGATSPFGTNGTSNTCATGTLAVGGSCAVGASFSPTSYLGGVVQNGALTLTSNNSIGATQSVPLSGAALLGAQAVTFTSTAGPYNYGNAAIVLSATGGASGSAVTFSLVSGPGRVSGSTLAITGAGTIVVAANQAGNANYNPAPQSTQSIIVHPVTLTATLNGNPTKTYNGTTAASLTSTNYMLSGLLGTDNFTVTQTVGTYSAAVAGTNTVTAALSPSNFTASSGSVSNYTLPTSASGPGTITQANASVTPNSGTKIYGSADPVLGGKLTGFVAGDNVTATYSRAAGANVGSYMISAVLSPTEALSNYNITYATAAFTITPASASVTPAAAGRTYGATDPTLTGTLTGFIASDNVAASYSRTAGSNAGTYPISATLSPAAVLSNYNITYNTGVLTINPAAAAVTANPLSMTYGTAIPAATAAVTGVLPGDTLNYTVSLSAGTYPAVGTYPITVTVGSNANYNVTANNSQLTVNPATVTVAAAAQSKIYGTANPALTAAVTGVPSSGATLNYSLATTATVVSGVGTYPITVSIGSNPNYSVTPSNGLLTVNQAVATVTPAAAGKTYGTVDPTLSGTLTGFLVSDNVAASYSRTAGSNVGSYAINAVLSPAAVLSNYNITYNTAAFTITRTNLAAVIVGTPTKTYNGTTAATLTSADFQLIGVVSGDAIVVNQPVGSYTAATAGPETVSANLSAANFTATSGSLGNYSVPVTASGPGQVNQGTAAITWLNPAAIIYGAALSGAQLDATANVSGSFSYSPASGVLSAGQQMLTVTFTPTDSRDYTSSSASVVLTVSKATPAIKWANPAAIRYGTVLSGSQLNAIANVPGTFSYNPAVGSILNGGLQTLTVTFIPTNSNDYNTQTKSVSLQVNESTVSTGISSGTQTYQTWTNFVLGPSWSGNYSTSKVPTGTVTLSDNGSLLVTLPLGSNGLAYWTTSPPLNVGTHNLTVYYGGDGVYAPGLSAVTTITVRPAQVNFQASCSNGSMYNSSPWQCSVSISASTTTTPGGVFTYNLDGGDPVSVNVVPSGSATFTVPSPLPAGTHKLVLNYAAQGNYAAASPITVNVTVSPGRSELQISPSSYYLAHGSNLTLSGTLVTPNSGSPIGSVTFYDNGTAIGTSTVGANGNVSLTATNVTKGPHSYSAKYAGSANYTAASWGTASITAY